MKVNNSVLKYLLICGVVLLCPLILIAAANFQSDNYMSDKNTWFIGGELTVGDGGSVVFENGSQLVLGAGSVVLCSGSTDYNIQSGRSFNALSGSSLVAEAGSGVWIEEEVNVISGASLDLKSGSDLIVNGSVTSLGQGGDLPVTLKVSYAQVSASNTVKDGCTVGLAAGALTSNKAVHIDIAGTLDGITSGKTLYLTSEGNTTIISLTTGATVVGDFVARCVVNGGASSAAQKSACTLTSVDANTGIETKLDYATSAIDLSTARKLKIRYGTAAATGTIVGEICNALFLP